VKLFITGATGFVGREVVKQALKEGHTVKCLVRNRRKAQFLVQQGAELYEGDILSFKTLNAALTGGVDAIIHLVGIISEFGGQSYDSIHYSGSVNVIDAALRFQIKRFVHMSALGSRPNAPSPYHATKFQAEQYLRNSGLDWTIFRPSIIYGQNDEFINRFANLMKIAPFVPVFGDGEKKLQPISCEDVAKCIVSALNKEETTDKIYELGGPTPLSWNEIMKIIMGETGRNRTIIPIPYSVAMTMATLFEFPTYMTRFGINRELPGSQFLDAPVTAPSFLRKLIPFNRAQVIMAKEDNTCDMQQTKETFNLKLTPLKEGIRKYV